MNRVRFGRLFAKNTSRGLGHVSLLNHDSTALSGSPPDNLGEYRATPDSKIKDNKSEIAEVVRASEEDTNSKVRAIAVRTRLRLRRRNFQTPLSLKGGKYLVIFPVQKRADMVFQSCKKVQNTFNYPAKRNLILSERIVPNSSRKRDD